MQHDMNARIEKNFKKRTKSGDAGSRTPDLAHAKRTLYR